MKHLTLVLAGCASLLLIAGCSGEKGSAADDAVVATVDGRPISANTFHFYVEGVTRERASEVSAERKAELLDTLVRGELIAAEAERNGVAAQAETRAMLDLSRLEILQQASQAAWIKDNPVTEEELRAEYDVQVAALPQREYRARHILVSSEESAQRLIERIGKGAKFEELARKESLDQNSRINDGDLGWFTPERMVRPFAEAVVSLQPGQFTRKPVQTDYGWHLIKLEETRSTTPPPFEEVRDRLVQVVEARKFRAHTDELLKAAKVEKNL